MEIKTLDIGFVKTTEINFDEEMQQNGYWIETRKTTENFIGNVIKKLSIPNPDWEYYLVQVGCGDHVLLRKRK